MTDLQQQIETLSAELEADRVERDSQMALLEKTINQLEQRIEKLEGKERSAVYDPATNSVAEALIESIAISKPCVGDRARLERSLEIPLGSSPLLFEEVEKHLKRPGGLLEQLETAQRQTEERFSSLEDDLEAETAARMAADDALSASIKLLSK